MPITDERLIELATEAAQVRDLCSGWGEQDAANMADAQLRAYSLEITQRELEMPVALEVPT